MTKLISDHAQVEISNKVKDILRMYQSSSWHSEPYHKIRILLKGTIGLSKHGLTPFSTGLDHLPNVGYFAWAMCVTYSIISLVNLCRYWHSHDVHLLPICLLCIP